MSSSRSISQVPTPDALCRSRMRSWLSRISFARARVLCCKCATLRRRCGSLPVAGIILGRVYVGMLAADVEEQLTMLVLIKACHGIGAEEGEGMRLGQLVPDLFKPHCGFPLFIGPQ